MLVTVSFTDSLTHSRLVNLIDVTLACEDAYSKLVTVADVMEGLLGKKLLFNCWQFVADLEAEVWS